MLIMLRVIFAFALCLEASALNAQVDVLTRNYNNQRTGSNLAETALTSSNVNAANFGRLFQVSVDDQVYSGLLYVANLAIAGGTHNVFFVATENNSVYAFNADSGGNPLWKRNFNGSGRPTVHTEVGQTCGTYTNFTGNIGITGTPVIDKSSKTIFVVTRTVEGNNTVQRLHALDITTGNERANSPQVITATVPGTNDGNTNVVFDPKMSNQRPALALNGGAVYIAWASYCDTYKFYGWVMAYDSVSLAQVGTFNVSPNGGQGGIWMGGGAPAFDQNGNIFFTSGNGAFDGHTNYSQSVIKLSPRTLKVLDYYTPTDYATLNAGDLDLGPSGPSFLPGTNLLVQGDKPGKLHLLNSANLGHLAGDTQVPQTFQAVSTTPRPGATHHVHNSTVNWPSPQGLNLYVWGENDYLRSYRFNGTVFNAAPSSVGAVLPPFGMPGGMMTVSSNGSQAGTGVLWASVPFSGDAQNSTVPGILYAFNAENLNLLWSSSASADNMGNFPKYNPPVVANGKVYVASFSNLVSVYGLKFTPPPPSGSSFNAGGPANGSFNADQYFTGGAAGATTNAISTAGVANAAPAAVYQTERLGNFTYKVPNLTPGTQYTVRLHFAEFYWTAIGKRRFNVSLNGYQVLTNFDIFAAAGANQATTRQFASTADPSGKIAIDFTAVVDNAKVSAIEVIPGAPTYTGAPINAGGSTENPFVTDRSFAGGWTGSTNTAIDTTYVVNPAPAAVYQSQRSGNFTYTIGGYVPNSPHKLRLHFAETYWNGPRQRKFSVMIGSRLVLNNFDILSTAGAKYRALIIEVNVNADPTGQLVIRFAGQVDYACVSGIEIL